MDLLPNNITTMSMTSTKDSQIRLRINENASFIYNNINTLDNNIVADLIECSAFATTLLYLNENYQLVANATKEELKAYYETCESLLGEHTQIVEEAGIPLTSIKGYPIYEGKGYILRGAGKKKIKEQFIEEEEACGTNAQCDSALQPSGTQCDDIAPKKDQDFGATPRKKKKHYDVLLSGLQESQFNFINKGFTKNLDGYYQRGNYILVKEGDSFKAVHFNKLKEE